MVSIPDTLLAYIHVSLEALTAVSVRDVTPCSLVELYLTSEIQAAGFPETLVNLKQSNIVAVYRL
jgi:hypothetical protein